LATPTLNPSQTSIKYEFIENNKKLATPTLNPSQTIIKYEFIENNKKKICVSGRRPTVDRTSPAEKRLRTCGSSEKNRRNQILVSEKCRGTKSHQRETGMQSKLLNVITLGHRETYYNNRLIVISTLI
jgi:hypothetical protein